IRSVTQVERYDFKNSLRGLLKPNLTIPNHEALWIKEQAPRRLLIENRCLHGGIYDASIVAEEFLWRVNAKSPIGYARVQGILKHRGNLFLTVILDGLAEPPKKVPSLLRDYRSQYVNSIARTSGVSSGRGALTMQQRGRSDEQDKRQC